MFWNSRAGPPGFPVFDLLTRSVISAISRMGSASFWMRFSSPARSRAAIHWRRSSKGKRLLLRTTDYTELLRRNALATDLHGFTRIEQKNKGFATEDTGVTG